MSITTQVFILFIVVLVGAFCRKRDYFTDETIRGVTQLVVNITVPALMIANMQQPFDQTVLVNFLLTVFTAAAVVIISLMLGLWIFRNRPIDKRAVLANMCAFTNCGFMGYPIVLAFNPHWMIYAVGYNVATTFTTWTIGVNLFSGKNNMSLRRALLNPNIIAAVIGFAIFLLNIELPYVLSESLSMIGGLTTPLTMLLIGTRVCGIELKNLRDIDYHLSALLRLIVFPLIVYAIMQLLPLAPAVKGIVFLLTAMPAGTIVAMEAELYGGDAVFASRAIAWSTLLSLISVPVMGLLL